MKVELLLIVQFRQTRLGCCSAGEAMTHVQGDPPPGGAKRSSRSSPTTLLLPGHQFRTSPGAAPRLWPPRLWGARSDALGVDAGRFSPPFALLHSLHSLKSRSAERRLPSAIGDRVPTCAVERQWCGVRRGRAHAPGRSVGGWNGRSRIPPAHIAAASTIRMKAEPVTLRGCVGVVPRRGPSAWRGVSVALAFVGGRERPRRSPGSERRRWKSERAPQ